MSRRSDAARQLAELQQLISLVGELRLRNCPLRPTARQEAFLRLASKEVFYGGAAGGGKSVAMLMAALQYSDVPGYRALLLRPSQSEFSLGGGLLELSHDWLAQTRARWSGDSHSWHFPGPGKTGAGGATLTFGYLGGDHDLGRYAGSSYSFVGFDELTRFKETHYRRMFRTLRQPSEVTAAARDGTALAQVPVRIRATSNPGGVGHAWVKDRFVNPTSRHPKAVFLPSSLADNPHLDIDTYVETLGELPSAELERLLHGNWDIPDDGDLFRRDWFPLIEAHQLPDSNTIAVRAWDLAATEPSARNRDPDWTVGIRMLLHQPTNSFYVADIIRERKAPGAIQQLLLDTARHDGTGVKVAFEQEPGSAGKFAADQLRKLLSGYPVYTYPAAAPKHERAWPVAGAAETGRLQLARGRHTSDFLDELVSFPHGSHDDTIDALALAHTHLTKHNYQPAWTSIPQGRIDFDPYSAHRALISEDDIGYLSRVTGIPIYNPRNGQI